ncbi:MAG: hypothetical protein ACI8UO_000365 [Verrucomicrobiales bacterium]|jgi:hypothetical protein
MMLKRIAIFLTFASGVLAQGEPSTIYLKTGEKLEGEITEVSQAALQWRIPEAAAGTRSISFSDVIWVAFPPTEQWRAALTAFYTNNYEEAIPKLKAIASTKSSSTFYPAPGNFSTLADRRLLDCYRQLIQPSEIPVIQDRIEWEKLPPEERGVKIILDLWSAVGKENWDGALTIAAKLDEELEPGHGARAEVAYLRGRALESKGEGAEALLAYGGIIGPFPGASRRLTSDALKRTAALLEKDAERAGELKAIVHIYAKSFGNGTLWAEATASMRKLLGEPIESAAAGGE